MNGRWSELRVLSEHHSEFKAMWEEAIVRSGEVEKFLREEMRVGESRLRSRMLKFVILASARSDVVGEYQAGLWTWKSHMMMLSSQKLERR